MSDAPVQPGTTAVRSAAHDHDDDVAVPHEDDVVDQVADGVDTAVRKQPAIEAMTRLGWIAKGIVYLLMGGTAISIARQQPTDDDASPTGAVDRIADQPGGRLLLGVLAVGLVLYCLWRLLSVAVIRGRDASAWLDRVGYTLSAAFYAVLALTAARTAWGGRRSGQDNSVERLSRSMMGSGWGRWVLIVAGLVTIAVGAYFVVRKGVMRTFVDDLQGVNGGLSRNEGVGTMLLVSGFVGWIGRGIVTILVGFFVTRAAWRFDPDDARGFDRALRKVATTDVGTWLVWVSGLGLVLYGAFCLLSHRRRRLREHA